MGDRLGPLRVVVAIRATHIDIDRDCLVFLLRFRVHCLLISEVPFEVLQGVDRHLRGFLLELLNRLALVLLLLSFLPFFVLLLGVFLSEEGHLFTWLFVFDLILFFDRRHSDPL